MSLVPVAPRPALRFRKPSEMRRSYLSCSLALSLLSALPACSSSDERDENSEIQEPSEASGRKDAGSKDAGAGSKPTVKRDASTSSANDRPDPAPTNPDAEMCAGIEQSTPAAPPAVDVIFVIDTSGSMIDEQAKVTANMSAFMQDFASTPADTHVIVVTGSDPAAGANVDPASYRFVPSSVDSKVLYAVAGLTLPLYSDFLRPNAVTHMVFISDDNDIFPGDAFKSTMEQTLGHGFTFHAIVATQAASCGFGFGGAMGTNYLSLAKSTGGMELSICTDDWSTVFGELKKGIVEAVPLPCDYPLADAKGGMFDAAKLQMVHTPEGGTPSQFPKASTREECADKAGWHYDDNVNPSTISLCPVACETVRAGGTIQIVLGCPPDPIAI